MTKSTKILVWIGVIFIIIGFIGKFYYRDYIYSNNINDYGIAGFLPSYVDVVGLSLMLLISELYKKERFPQLYFLFVTIGSILYELNQYRLSGVLDVGDIIASISGGITAFLIFWLVNRKEDKRNLLP